MVKSTFKSIEIGTVFIFAGVTYQKIKPIKDCCDTLYNATDYENGDPILFNEFTLVIPVDIAPVKFELSTEEVTNMNRMRTSEFPVGSKFKHAGKIWEKIDEIQAVSPEGTHMPVGTHILGDLISLPEIENEYSENTEEPYEDTEDENEL